MKPVVYNTAWMSLCCTEAMAFRRAARDVERIQGRLLRAILNANRRTWYGARYRFASIRTVQEFQDAAPLVNYEDLGEPIQRIVEGQQQVLTAEPVELLEPTGGSAGGEKLIPYTASLRRAFQRAVRAWIWDLYASRPAVRQGTAYWSISPMAAEGRISSGGIPIGFNDDTSYLGTIERGLVKRTLAVPPIVALSTDVPSCQYATLFFLLRDSRLSLTSVWSPAFLTQLLLLLWRDWESLCDDVERGRLSVAGGKLVHAEFEPLPGRAGELRAAFEKATDIRECIRTIWPMLRLVSCWADGPSTAYARELAERLDGIEIQPKGLLATEAFVTIPLTAAPAPALAIRSHFFEFQPVDPTGANCRALLAHQLTAGGRYQVIVTTQGGLYRYQLYDEVEVVGFHRELPLLRFIGKADLSSDLVGEKVSAAQIERALQLAFSELLLAPRFRVVVPDVHRRRYVLYVCDDTLAPSIAAKLCACVESNLFANPAYAYARQLGQLEGLETVLVDDAFAQDIFNRYLQSQVSAGRRLGDVKTSSLIPATSLPAGLRRLPRMAD